MVLELNVSRFTVDEAMECVTDGVRYALENPDPDAEPVTNISAEQTVWLVAFAQRLADRLLGSVPVACVGYLAEQVADNVEGEIVRLHGYHGLVMDVVHGVRDRVLFAVEMRVRAWLADQFDGASELAERAWLVATDWFGSWDALVTDVRLSVSA